MSSCRLEPTQDDDAVDVTSFSAQAVVELKSLLFVAVVVVVVVVAAAVVVVVVAVVVLGGSARV